MYSWSTDVLSLMPPTLECVRLECDNDNHLYNGVSFTLTTPPASVRSLAVSAAYQGINIPSDTRLGGDPTGRATDVSMGRLLHLELDFIQTVS